MNYYARIDVSLECSRVCFVDENGRSLAAGGCERAGGADCRAAYVERPRRQVLSSDDSPRERCGLCPAPNQSISSHTIAINAEAFEVPIGCTTTASAPARSDERCGWPAARYRTPSRQVRERSAPGARAGVRQRCNR